MLDFRSGNKPRSVQNKICRQLLFAHLGEVRCVRTVVTPNDEQQIHANIEQFAQRILPLLCSAADRVKAPEIFLSKFRPVSINDCLTNSALHFLSLPAQHCRLISYTNGLQVRVWIEAWRMRALKSFQERLSISTAPDVIANVIGICQRQDNEVVSATIAESARTRGFGLFVFRLPVNNGCSRFTCVFAYSLPNAHHVPASRINNLATAILDLLLDRQFGSKRRHDDDVVGTEIGDIRFLIFASEILDT